MRIAAFGVEEWMNAYETKARNNIAETCVESMTVDELLELTEQPDIHLEAMRGLHLTYGDITGSLRLRSAAASLYKGRSADDMLICRGGIEANFLALWTLVEPGDHVVAILPTYQQLYSLPESFGANVTRLAARAENSYLPDIEALKDAVNSNTKLIILNYPNNPTGAVLSDSIMREIVSIADRAGAWIHCDEIYRGLEHDAPYSIPSFADIYDRATSSGSLSKVYSLAGLRIGWLTGPKHFIQSAFSHRDYTTISCSRIDDLFASVALEHRSRILERNIPLVQTNLKILSEWVDSEPRVSFIKPKGGTTALLHLDISGSSEEFCRRLMEEKGTLIVPGECFELEKSARIGYAPRSGTLREGLDAVSGFLKKLS